MFLVGSSNLYKSYILVTNYFTYFAILCIFELGTSLVTLPEVEDNSIIKTESVIRETFNTIFSTLRLKKVRDKPRIKHYSVVHNYFVSLTLQDYNSLKEIAKLTKVDTIKLDNVTTNYYIALLNEILDEDNVHKLHNIMMGKDDKTEYDIDSEIEKLEDLKKYADQENKSKDLNKEILRILQQDSLELNSTTENSIHEDDENILTDLPTWKQDDDLASGRRIYNSKQTKIKKYPFMASVQIFNKFQCAGSIIKSDLIITAASCLQLAWNNRFYRENPSFLSVRVGSSFYEYQGESIGVLEVYFHPSYTPNNLHNNIAIMRLYRKIHLQRKKVKKIILDTEESALPINVQKVEILGWGAFTSDNRQHSAWADKLRHSSLSVYSLLDCQDIYSKEYVTTQNFCAGSISFGSGACNHDVGGPGIVSGKLTGIISFGAPVCGTFDAPTVFTKVGYYTDWIEEIMERDVPNIRQPTTNQERTYTYKPPKWYYNKSKIWTVEPVSTIYKKIAIGPITITYTETPKKPDLRHLDKKLFKEFLKTMFESDEIQEYFDSVKIQPVQREDLQKHQPKPKGETQQSLMQEPIQQPVNQQPVMQEPFIQQPFKQQTLMQEPVTQESILEEPLLQEPIQPIDKQPVITQERDNSQPLYLPIQNYPVLEPRITAGFEEPTTLFTYSESENTSSEISGEISDTRTVLMAYEPVTDSIKQSDSIGLLMGYKSNQEDEVERPKEDLDIVLESHNEQVGAKPTYKKPKVNSGRPKVNSGRLKVNSGKSKVKHGRLKVNSGKLKASRGKPKVNNGKNVASTYTTEQEETKSKIAGRQGYKWAGDDAVKNKIDDAILALFYLSDNEDNLTNKELDFGVTIPMEKKQNHVINNKFQPVGLMYRGSEPNIDSIFSNLDLRKFLTEDNIIDLLTKEIERIQLEEAVWLSLPTAASTASSTALSLDLVTKQITSK